MRNGWKEIRGLLIGWADRTKVDSAARVTPVTFKDDVFSCFQHNRLHASQMQVVERMPEDAADLDGTNEEEEPKYPKEMAD